MKKILILAITALTVISIASCDTANRVTNDLIGSWTGKSVWTGNTRTLTFTETTFSLSEDGEVKCSWPYTISVSPEGKYFSLQDVNIFYKVSGNTLSITGTSVTTVVTGGDVYIKN